MTHEEMLRFQIYRNGSQESQSLALRIADFAQSRLGLRFPSATDNNYLVWPDNVLLMQTIARRKSSVTLNVSGPSTAYSDLASDSLRVVDARPGQSRLFVLNEAALEDVFTAIERSWRRHEDTGPGPDIIPSIRYWFTTHWPLTNEHKGEHHRNVYLQSGRQSVAQNMSPGDKVLIYESKTGPTIVEEFADGTRRRIAQGNGRSGIVTVAEIAEPLSRRPGSEGVAKYADGTEMNWAWKATTRHHVSNGFVAKPEVLRVLEYAPSYAMRGIGPMNSGLREISQSQYEDLLRMFVGSTQAKGTAPGGEEPPPGYGGPEGIDHRTLKEYVAACPSIALNEDRITTLKMEYSFRSGDRADVVLKDETGRFIGVEVEISQSDKQTEGLLQAIKYRHMVAVTEGVTFEECRAVLIAYSLSNRIKELCHRYDVTPIEIKRPTVEEWNVARARLNGFR
jgi:hypothetical protein